MVALKLMLTGNCLMKCLSERMMTILIEGESLESLFSVGDLIFVIFFNNQLY